MMGPAASDPHRYRTQKTSALPSLNISASEHLGRMLCVRTSKEASCRIQEPNSQSSKSLLYGAAVACARVMEDADSSVYGLCASVGS